MVRLVRIPTRERGNESASWFPGLWFPRFCFPRSSVGTHTGFSAPDGLQPRLYAFPFMPFRVRGSVGTRSRGFTLLEMLLVIFLMALVASTGLMLTEGVEDQSKYDETKRRMELIRKAIVGDPTRTVNGGPEISGFVADMGRLPGCLAELIEITPDPDNPEKFLSPCDGATEIPLSSLDPNSGLRAGWRGPYIQVLPERTGDLRFRDGYDNEGATVAADALNSGWIWQLYEAGEDPTTVVANAVILRIQSFGLDGTQPYPQGIVTDPTPTNRPIPLVVSNDWQIQLPLKAAVMFKNQSAGNLPVAAQNLVLRIYLSDLTNYIDADDGSNDYLALAADSVLALNNNSQNFTLNTTPKIPQGMRSYALVCYAAPPADPDDFVVFDKDCDAGNGVPDISNIRTFAVTSRQNLNLNLDWIIQ
jgi:prepilin-type N-terminal cleavage/methylation domain-containing protein